MSLMAEAGRFRAEAGFGGFIRGLEEELGVEGTDRGRKQSGRTLKPSP